jgi:hypothetical protein
MEGRLLSQFLASIIMHGKTENHANLRPKFRSYTVPPASSSDNCHNGCLHMYLTHKEGNLFSFRLLVRSWTPVTESEMYRLKSVFIDRLCAENNRSYFSKRGVI